MVSLLLTGLSLSLWVIISNRRSITNWLLFGMISLSLSAILFDYVSNSVQGLWAIYLTRLSYSFYILAVLLIYLFSRNFPFKNNARVWLKYVFFCVAIILALITLFTNFVIKETVAMVWGGQIELGVMINAVYAFIITAVLATFYTFLINYRKSSKIDKQRIRMLIIGAAIFVALEIIFNILLPLINIQYLYFIGDYSIIVFFGLTAFAIVKRHLFDVRLAIVRSVTYSLVLVTFAGIYLAIAYAISAIFNTSQTNTGQIVSGVATSLLLAFIFQPLKRFFDKLTNRVFYKDNYNTDDFFARLNKALSITTDLRNLLERVAYEISTTLKSEQAFFFIYTNGDGHFLSAGTDNHNHLPKHDAILVEQKSQGIDNIIAESSLAENDPIRRMMVSHRIALILPLMQDDAVVGYLCLGDHLNSGYTNRDIKALNTLSDELIIAIQNALAVHEIRELNATLQQKVINATKELRANNAILRQLDKIKDEFISMASHQLRTPLTSVKGYISMVIEGDVGKITDPQKQLLDQAYMSSERMVHLINDFLNVSRIQTGKFIIDKSSVDLSKLVSEEIDSLRPNATMRNMKFIYKPPKNFPVLDIDESKMRQVVMNFADNAIYYSHENSSINVNLSVEDGEVLFTVKDTGIGVPVNEREKLFSKFYRASNARVQRPDGTGVGIYLAKKVIDAHGGKVVFDSVVGKGSTFGFRLPIKTLELAPADEPPETPEAPTE